DTARGACHLYVPRLNPANRAACQAVPQPASCLEADPVDLVSLELLSPVPGFLNIHGSAAATKTPMACSGSTSREQQTSPRSRRTNSTPSHCGLTSDPEKPWTSRPRPIGCTRCCSDQLNPPPH